MTGRGPQATSCGDQGPRSGFRTCLWAVVTTHRGLKAYGGAHASPALEASVIPHRPPTPLPPLPPQLFRISGLFHRKQVTQELVTSW